MLIKDGHRGCSNRHSPLVYLKCFPPHWCKSFSTAFKVRPKGVISCITPFTSRSYNLLHTVLAVVITVFPNPASDRLTVSGGASSRGHAQFIL